MARVQLVISDADKSRYVQPSETGRDVVERMVESSGSQSVGRTTKDQTVRVGRRNAGILRDVAMLKGPAPDPNRIGKNT